MHGVPAMGMPLPHPMEMEVTLSSRLSYENDWTVSRDGHRLVVDAQAIEALNRAFMFICERLNLKGSWDIKVEAGLPLAAGLGASAALGVALIHALCERFDLCLNQSEMYECALLWEREFHMNPSGVDVALVLLGLHAPMAGERRVLKFQHHQPDLQAHWPQGWNIVVADTGEASRTKERVKDIEQYRSNRALQFNKNMDAVGVLVNNAWQAMLNADAKTFGHCMDLNQHVLSAMLLSNESIERLCGTARSAGALGAKMTGAGGGGCIIALVEEPKAEAVAQALGVESSWVKIV